METIPKSEIEMREKKLKELRRKAIKLLLKKYKNEYVSEELLKKELGVDKIPAEILGRSIFTVTGYYISRRVINGKMYYTVEVDYLASMLNCFMICLVAALIISPIALAMHVSSVTSAIACFLITVAIIAVIGLWETR